MIDLEITKDGDIVLDKNDINTITKDELRYQDAFIRIKSITNDWFNESNLGANMEELIGMANIKNTALIGIEKITSSLTQDGTYNSDEIFIDYTTDKHKLGFKVFLRNIDGLTSKLLIVEIDLIGGINIKVGGD